MSTPLTPEREKHWREMARVAPNAYDWPTAADRYFVEGGMQGIAELLGELDRVRDELAEVRAGQDPRLRCLIVKAAPDKDMYIGWSTICDMPAGIWTRAEAEAWGFPNARLDRADQNGSSATNDYTSGHWDDPGFVAEQRGWLRRDRVGDYALLWLTDRQDEAFNLLEPLEGETEVRR